MSKGKILFQLTGSIAAYKSCSVISKLVQGGYEVETVATRHALEFVGEATLEGLTGRAVHTDTFERGRYMSHINLMKWADLAILCPASANTINKLSAGIGDDLVSTLFLAHDFNKPYLIAPAMNTRMYLHPATQASLKQLRSWSVQVLETGAGNLACGDVGEGRLLEPDRIFDAIEKALGAQPSSTRSLNLLITSGGTREPIDGVRSIANFSSGRTGARIAESLLENGHRVTFLHAKDSALPRTASSSLRDVHFTTFSDLERALSDELGKQRYDGVLHLAAVSDFSVAGLEAGGRTIAATGGGKIDSNEDLTLRLKRNPKLVDRLRQISLNPEIKVVAFKLTNTPDPGVRSAAVEKLSAHAKPDWIVQNDLSEVGSSDSDYRATIYVGRKPTETVASVSGKTDLARKLERLLTEGRS